MDLGQMIKMNREKTNISMNELARRAGIAQSGLSKIEAGQRQPTFDLLERIIAFLI
jgi:transcriptional regulator with XRE-family HTH domain